MTIKIAKFEGGLIELDGVKLNNSVVTKKKVFEKTQVNVSVKANDDYQISSVTVGDNLQNVTDINQFNGKFTAMADTDITVKFDKVYRVTITYNKNGVVTPAANTDKTTDGGVVKVKTTDGIELVATPNDTYRVSEVLIDGKLDASVKGNTYNHKNPYKNASLTKEDHTVVITFAPLGYSVKVNSPKNGKLFVDHSNVDYNGKAIVTITPNTGYQVSKLTVNGDESFISDLKAGTGNDDVQLVLEKITETKTVNVTFAKCEVVSMSDISWNQGDAIKSDSEKNQYVFSKDTKVKFSTESKGLRIIYADNTQQGSRSVNVVTINESKTIKKIEVCKGLFWQEVKVNDKSVALDIVIDKTEPEVKVLPQNVKGNDEGYFIDDVLVDISVEDESVSSDLKSVEYWIINGENQSSVKSLFINDDTNVSADYNSTIIVSASDYVGDDVQVHVKAVDRAGNETEKTASLHINTKAPTMTLSFTDKKHTDAVDGYYNDTRTGEITITDREDCFDSQRVKLTIKINNKEITAPVVSWSSNGNIHKGTFELTDAGKYTDCSVSYTNRTGMTAENVSEHSFVIDKTAPTGTISVDEISWKELIQSNKFKYSLFKNKMVTVTAEAKDELSGVQFTKYYRTDSNEALDGETLETLYKAGKFVDSAYSFNSDEKFTVYARITDNAGNTRYISTNGVIVDMTQSVISFQTEREADSNGFYNKDFWIKVSVKENVNPVYSGIQSVKYYVVNHYNPDKEIGDQKITQQGTFIVSNSDIVTDKVNFIASKNDCDDVKLIIVAVDNAGNESVAVSDKFSVNMTKPKVAVSFDNNDIKKQTDDGREYYQSARTATLVYTDRASAFDEANATQNIVIRAVDADGKSVAVNKAEMIHWKHEGDKHTAIVTFDEDANYTVSVAYTNKAGWSLEEDPVIAPFTVDATAPTGELMISGKTINPNSVWQQAWDKFLSFVTFGLYSHDNAVVSASADDKISPTVIEYCKLDKALSVQNINDFSAALDQLTFKPFEQFEVAPNEQFVVYLKVSDYAGNYTYIMQDNGVVVDNQESKIAFEAPTANLNGIYNHDIDVKVTVKDGDSDSSIYSGIQTIVYKVIADEVVTQKYTYQASIEAGRVREYTFTVPINATLNNSCDVKLEVYAIDNAGNGTAEPASIHLDFDVTAPEISVTYSDKQNQGAHDDYYTQRTATVTIQERTAHFNAGVATLGITTNTKATDYDGNEIKDAFTVSEWKTVKGNTPDQDTHTATVTFAKDANYAFGVQYVDDAGNGAETYEDTFTVDTTAPKGTVTATAQEGNTRTWSEKADSLFFAFWSKVSLAFSKTERDDISPIDSVKYYIDYFVDGDTPAVLTDDVLDKVDWPEFKEFSVKAEEDGNKQFVVYLKITDYAGNYAYISTNGLIVDKELPDLESVAPEISVTPEKPINGIYNGDVKVRIMVNDPIVDGVYSGLNSVRYEVYDRGSGKTKPTQEGVLLDFDRDYNNVWTQENINHSREIDTTITVFSALNNSNDVQIVVYAEDNAGNKSDNQKKDSKSYTSIKIDTTAPVLDISYDNNSADSGTYFKANRTATVKITERNFNPQDVKITITNTDGVIPAVVGWKNTEGSKSNKDDSTHTATITYNADGDYTFAIAYTDLAGNQCKSINYAAGTVAGTKFTVDKTIPTVKVSYNNNSAQNKNYYKNARTATIVINEHNFSTDRVNISIKATDNGTVKSAPSVSRWTTSGNLHTATIHYSSDALYTFDIDYTDLAGNKAADYTPDTFYIDRTPPVIAIDGVKNKASFGKEYQGKDITPNVKVVEDNFDGKVLVTLTGKRRENNNAYSVTDKSFKVKNIENDDVYSLKIDVTDKAGNHSEKIISPFYVSRNGSIFNIGDALKKINSRHLNASPDQNIIFQEESVIPIDLNKVVIRITMGDNKPKELYYSKSNAAENDDANAKLAKAREEGRIFTADYFDENGWNKYTYTIDKSMFASDGNYSITIESVDTEGNVSKSAEKVEKVSFRVDTNPPEITTDDLNPEHYAEYATTSKLVTLVIEDTYDWNFDDFNTLEIYLNGENLMQTGTHGVVVISDTKEITFEVDERNTRQHVDVLVADSAGNTNEMHYEFLVSTNIFARWFNNTPLFIGSIAGFAVLIIAIVAFVLFGKRRKVEY